MNIRDIQTLYDYNYWATRRILAASARVSPEQFLSSTAHSYGSLRGTLVHTLDAECAWRMLCQHQTLASFEAMEEGAFPTLDTLEQRWKEEEKYQSTDFDYTGSDDEPWKNPEDNTPHY